MRTPLLLVSWFLPVPVDGCSVCEAAEIIRWQLEHILEDEGSLVLLRTLTFSSCSDL